MGPCCGWSCGKVCFDTEVLQELQVHPYSLRFKDGRTEDGFVELLSGRLPKLGIGVSLCLLPFQMTQFFGAIIQIAFNDFSYESEFVCKIIEIILSFINISFFVVALLQQYRKLWSAARFETIVIVGSVLTLILLPFSEVIYVARVLRVPVEIDDCGFSDTFVVFRSYTVITCSCLMPLRWGMVRWVLCFQLVWYWLFRHVVFSDTRNVQLTSYFYLLCLISGIGKRVMELQERRLFRTVTLERTLRARSEFELSRQEQGNRNDRPHQCEGSVAPSYATAEMFSMSDGEEVATARFERIAATAYVEQWLIDPARLKIDPDTMLGQGGFGAVFEGSMNKLPVAVKVAIGGTHEASAKRTAELLTELRVLRKLRHPNIVTFHGAVVDTALCEVALVLEFVPGPTLGNFVRAPKEPLADKTVYALVCGIVRAMLHMHHHQPPILHLDLKPNNVLVASPDAEVPSVKIVDFGLSRIMSNEARARGGAMPWMAPELVNGASAPTAAADVYSVGRIAMYTMSRQEPFLTMKASKIRRYLMAGKVPRSDPPEDCSATYQQLWLISEECTTPEAFDRVDIDQLRNLLQRLLLGEQFLEQLRAPAHACWGNFFVRQCDKKHEGAERRLPEGSECDTQADSADAVFEPVAWADAIATIGQKLLKHRQPGSRSLSKSASVSRSKSANLAPILECDANQDNSEADSPSYIQEGSCAQTSAIELSGKGSVTATAETIGGAAGSEDIVPARERNLPTSLAL